MLIRRKKKNERGQAMFEFIMIMPLILTFIWYMVHINSAINKSIVAQVNTRNWLFVKLFNHSHGPAIYPQAPNRSSFVMGVAGEVIPEGEAGYRAPAPVEVLGMGPKPKDYDGADDEPGEPTGGVLRQKVRIRTAFGICTARKMRKNAPVLTDMCGS
jgi:hypothetical protein